MKIQMNSLNKVKAAIRAETPEGKLYIKHCTEFGLAPDILGKECEYKNETWTVEGLLKRGRLYFIRLKNERDVTMPIDINTAKNKLKLI